jgi:hypothetical protein
VLGLVLLALDVLAKRPCALDRHRPHAPAAAAKEELRRGGCDRPAFAAEERRERPEGRERRDEPACVALERRGQMLHEVHLVDVAARDRLPHLLDGGCVVIVGPAALPLSDSHTSRA